MQLVDVVKLYYLAVDKGDVPGLLDLFSDGATYLRPGYPPLVGHADLREFYVNQRVISEGRHTCTQLLSVGDQVAVRGEFAGLTREGGWLHLEFADFFRGGERIAWRQTFFYTPLA